MCINFIPIASGSDGNCILISTNYTNILVDAGISCKKVEIALNEIKLELSKIDAILVTHEHTDHINGVGVISRKYDIPIFATNGTWKAMQNKIGKIGKLNRKFVYPNERFVLNDLCIYPFLVPHDAVEPICYNIYYNYNKICILTDLGYVTKGIVKNIKDCNLLFLESNHDIDMLKASSYPDNLKNRILGNYGHMSNDLASRLLCHIAHKNLNNVFLGHLSKENNTPELAYKTVCNRLIKNNININEDLNIYIANDYGIKDMIKVN